MGFFDIFKKKKKMSDGLEKTRTDFFQNIVNTLTSSVIDDDLYNDLEEQLILADVGPSCAVRLVDELRDEVEINGLHTGQEALDAQRQCPREKRKEDDDAAHDVVDAVVVHTQRRQHDPRNVERHGHDEQHADVECARIAEDAV